MHNVSIFFSLAAIVNPRIRGFQGCVVMNIAIFQMSCLNVGVFPEEITSFVVTKLSSTSISFNLKSMFLHTHLVCLSHLLLRFHFDYFYP